MKYIDAEKLKEEIQRLKQPFKKDIEDGVYPTYLCALLDFDELIDSLQQKPIPDTDVLQTELINLLKKYRIGEETARTIADRIADTYGTQRYMDGLCDGLNEEDLKQEQRDVDLEREIDNEWKKCNPIDEGMGVETANIHIEAFDMIARHFCEFGKKDMKEQMLQEAVEGYVNYYEDSGGILMAEAQVGCPYHNGDKVRIIIVKEEETNER